MVSLKRVIERCGFALTSLSCLLIPALNCLLTLVDLHGFIYLFTDLCGFAWISLKLFIDFCGFAWTPLNLLLSVVELHESPYAFYGFLWICRDAWISLKLFIDFCRFAWIPLNLLLTVLDLRGSP